MQATNAFTVSAMYELHKASFRNAPGLPLTPNTYIREMDYKNLKLLPRQSVWIRLDKYWKSIGGQSWLPVTTTYTAGGANNLCFTSLLFEHTYPNGARIATVTTDYYIRFRNVSA